MFNYLSHLSTIQIIVTSICIVLFIDSFSRFCNLIIKLIKDEKHLRYLEKKEPKQPSIQMGIDTGNSNFSSAAIYQVNTQRIETPVRRINHLVEPLPEGALPFIYGHHTNTINPETSENKELIKQLINMGKLKLEEEQKEESSKMNKFKFIAKKA